MRPVAEGVALGCGFLGQRLQIRDLEGEMGQIRADHHWATGVILADLDLFFRAGGFEKDQFGTSSALASADFLQTEDITVKGNCLFEVLNAIAGVEEFGDHLFKGYSFQKLG